MAYDYGNPERGPSFEETNFRSALEGMGHDVVAFDFMERERVAGRAQMRRELVAAAAEARADVAFFCIFTDQLDAETIEAVRRAGGAPTVNWFTDDHWRFEGFSRHLAPAFDLAVTTDPDALPKYAAAGIENVLLSQWACNRYAYSKVSDAIEHDVTFVGQPHGNRPELMERLRAAGYGVEAWGVDWPAGGLTHDEMVRVFSTSRINLNPSNSSLPPNTLRARVGRLRGRPSGPPRVRAAAAAPDQGPQLRGPGLRRVPAHRARAAPRALLRARPRGRGLRGPGRSGRAGRLLARSRGRARGGGGGRLPARDGRAHVRPSL